jgi:alkanesulfonate monooxygenase SsuD/methylene tetrahydromethanopterin reductase-like flavin-dependent oxidoreductase (luciferase family)
MMQIFVELTRFAATASSKELRPRVRQLEDAGAAGISLWDHIFTTSGADRREGVGHACDPMTTLGAVLGASDALEVQTVVMNSDWINPGLLIRQFAQLGVLAGGGTKVTVGLGAGWSKEEFDALGMRMAPFRERIDRLAETLEITRQMLDHGWADYEGQYRRAVALPLSPVPDGRMKVLIGGGSDRILELAGKYADYLDIHGDPKFGSLVGASMAEKHHRDTTRRALTTAEGLSERYSIVQAAAERAGRPRDAVKTSVQVWFTVFGEGDSVREREAQICTEWGHIPPKSLADNPYILIGTPEQMAESLLRRRELFGLERISVKEVGPDADTDVVRLCREVGRLIR